MRAGIAGVAAVILSGAVTVAVAEEKSEKPLISCDKIVETYKRNQSVDETSSALMVDQSRVAECLKGAGIAAPAEDDD
jgi:hypothetical protein